MNYHYLEQYLANTQHRIGVIVIGAGGTGSHILTNLATMSHALSKLGRSPLMVTTYDPDIVEDHNVGRQMFSPADIGQNKAVVLTERINRFFGTDWSAKPVLFNRDIDNGDIAVGNIIITCVDTAKARREIGSYITIYNGVPSGSGYNRRTGSTYYWLDIGNSLASGQVLLGTCNRIEQPKGIKSPIEILPTWNVEFKGVRDKKTQPSCSLAESLGKQDLFVNKTMATFATNMLWQLFKFYRIHYRGIYVNLESMKTQPILI